MRLVTLKTLAGVAVTLVSASLAADQGVHIPQPVDVSRQETEQPEPQPVPEQEQQQPEQPEQQSEKLLLAALRFDTLFQYMTEMQRRFLQAILPESWAVPKFVPSMNTDLEQVHNFLHQVAEATGSPTVPATLVELAQSNETSNLLQGLQLPPVFQHLLSASMSSLAGIKDVNNALTTLSSMVPFLRPASLEVISRLFRVPSELEFPVAPEGLSLFLPVVVRNVANITVPPIESPEDVSQDVFANISDILVPVVDHEGQLLFADAPAVFQGIELPQQLALRPLALFSALEVEDVSDLWSAVKAPVMSKLSLLGSDAPALFGPVMTLASLPRVALSINGENQQLTGTSQLSKIVGDVSSRLRSGLRTFADLSVVDRIPQSTQALLRQPLEEFLNLRFLNFALPIVGLARQLEPGVFTPFQALTLCTDNDCPLGLSLPSFPEFLVSPETAISKLQERVQTLAMELQTAVLELQQKINSSLPEGVSTTTDSQGISLEEALNAALSLSGTLHAAVGIAGDRVNRLLGMDAAAAAAADAAAAAKTVLNTLENPTGLYASLYGRRQPAPAQEEDAGLLAPRRKLQSGGLINLPPLAGGIDLSRLEFPGQGSLEQLLSLRQLTSAVESFVLVEGSPLMSGLAPSSTGKSLGSLFKENALPESLLQQPLTNVLTDTSSLPAPFSNLNLGQFLSLSSALDNIFSSPLTSLPNLANLALNPSALLSLTPGVQAPEKLFTPPPAPAPTRPEPGTSGLFF